MSELTTCNYCNLKRIKARAKKEGNVVTTKPGWRGGTDVFVHPKAVNYPKDFKHEWDNEEGFNQYFTSWMQKIGKFCEC